MEVILNIGLAREGKSNIGVGTALREIANCGFELKAHTIVRSDTEDTVVARVEAALVETPARHLAILLEQDCIAAYLPQFDKGFLFGPRADKWGDFNPVYFFQLDGTRLGRGDLALAA